MLAYDSIICGYFCVEFIDFMLNVKSLLEYTNLLSPNEHKKNEKIILKYFQQNLNKLKCIVMFTINIETHIYIYIIYFKETLSLSIVYSKCGHEYEEKYLKKQNQLKY